MLVIYKMATKIKSAIILVLGLNLILISCVNSNTSEQTISTEQQNLSVATPKVKINLFNDIEKTRIVLFQNGIGELKKWHSDEMGGFMSITDYFQFGNNSAGMQNNLAYYLESDNENYIKKAKLVLNINSNGEKKQALNKFKEIVEATFKSLSLEIPEGLRYAITKEKDFQDNKENFTTTLKLNKSKIDTWKLEIETK